jgi:ABC-type transport system involved in multi-copper enzyme maturation permease subunit
MEPVFLFTFMEVIWWMFIVFFWVTFIAMFVATFADILGRHDMSGVSKVVWLVLILVLPIIGILIYMCFRPSDIRMAEQKRQTYGASAADDIAKAQQLLKSGTIDQAQFEELKRRALA